MQTLEDLVNDYGTYLRAKFPNAPESEIIEATECLGAKTVRFLNDALQMRDFMWQKQLKYAGKTKRREPS